MRDERVRLVEGARDDGWVDDDRQLGNRHLAFYVGDVDAEAARLREAGAEFTIEPQDVTGDVRLAFFLDPDGTLLELLSGPPRYHRSFAPGGGGAAGSRRAPGAGPPRDHGRAAAAGGPGRRAGRRRHADRFVAGPVPLELFSFPDGRLLPGANGNLKAVQA